MQASNVAAAQPASVERTGPVLVPPPQVEPNPWVTMGVLALVALVPRVLAFLVNENTNNGDAIIRTELAERWARDPHWISSFHDGAFQFGPLHLYAVGLFLKVWPSREHAGRLFSLLIGVPTVLPLYQLTRRLFGWRSAVVACLGLAVWGMHVQFSTTSSSEGLALFLTLSSLALFARALGEGRFPPLAAAALVLNLACATRYDAWLLIPVMCGLLLVRDEDRIASVTRAVLFGVLCMPFPLVWMQGNELATGHALYPMTYIDDFHRAWVGDGLGRYGQVGYRLHNLLFWPGAALFTLTPLVAIFGAVGMRRAWKEAPAHRWLIWVAVIPTAYFAFRGAVLANFAPLGRFTAGQVALLLPFVHRGFEWMCRKRTPVFRRGLAAVAAMFAIGFPLWLGLFTLHADGPVQSSLRPVSPTSTNPVELMRVAHFLRDEVATRGGAAIFDSDGQYRDLQLAFFGGLPEPRMARYRWEDFPKLLASADP
ncbi:MAG TPA: glycosyltransferase family 39 protein, partial [Myxococcaceae bacterium]|nr:glycosyltransferase family 39 protein [Myxococcaceae bacterium]